jgi:hypothetical protein
LSDDDYRKQVLHEELGAVPTQDELKYEQDEQINTTQVNTIELAAIDRAKPAAVKMEIENRSAKPIVEYNQLADVDISITTRDHETFKRNVLQLYEAIKKNCAYRGEVYIKEVRTLASIKYKLYGPGIPRPMEIFRIPYDPAKMVKKFHVHAVKMYYDNNVTLFRSCVACLLSGVGESYKWFACNKTPSSVLLKYAQRGFSIILNSKERNAISAYIEGDERWGKMLKHLDIPSDKIYCCVTADHPFFKPGLYGSGIRMTLRNFERDCNAQYASNLVVSYPKTLYPYGELNIKDNRKFYPPIPNLITACMDYVENGATDALADEDE